MWGSSSLMLTSTQVRVVITIAVLVWAVLLLLEGTPLRTEYLRPYAFAVGAATIALESFDLLLWRFWPFRLVARRPVVRGTWKGQLRSSWIDPATGMARPAKDVYLVIRQTYSTISLTLLTDESRSASTSASVVELSEGRYNLSSTYQSVPRLLLRSGSPIHHGALVLEANGAHPRRLEGSYWTDRDTKGELEFDSHTPSIESDFRSAAAAAYTDTR